MSYIYLNAAIEKYFSKDNLFEQVMQLEGEVYRALEGRSTKKIYINNNSYFIKQHNGIGLKEFLKNILQFRFPITGAKNEYLALQKLRILKVQVPEVLGFGTKGCNPAYIKSFIITEDLKDKISLEDFCTNWPTNPPKFELKQRIISKVACIAKILHENGINHRDFYICHFLLDQNSLSSKELQLYLIDLHRAGLRKKIPERWRTKDLAGLYFSCKNIGLTFRDLLRFISIYSGKPIRCILSTDAKFWMKVQNRGNKLYRKHKS